MTDNINDYIKTKLEEILNKMQYEATVTVKEADAENNIFINIESKEDIGRLIGKEGATLKALELLVRAIAGKQFSQSIRIVLDADNYLTKREENLKSHALDVLEKVERKGVPMELGEMTPRERRVIHMFLQGRTKIHTYSRGEGKDRRMFIAPGPAPSTEE